jgi:CDP-L-myo-inositol myo-inositolphosphotransferase
MQAVILAAGMGTRLGDLTGVGPKTLVDIDGRSIIDRILSSLALDEIDDIVVVGGFQQDLLEAHLAGRSGKKLILVENPNYRDGSVRTIEKALPHLRGSFVVVNGDHIHPREMIRDFVTQAGEITCACDFDRDLGADDMKVKLTDGRVTAMDKQLSDYDCGYIGMTFCHGDQMERYRAGLAATREKLGDKSNVEAIIKILAEDGYHPKVHDCSGYGWVEVDTPEDLENAKRLLRDNLYLKKL